MRLVAVLTDPATGNKVGVVDPCILADIAIVDPALTDGLPAQVTAATGIDALVHVIEAFIARVATPLARGLALEAARRIGRSLEVVCREPGNTAARDDMAIGSHLAGMAFANSSCCAVHAPALPLGGRFHIPHGVITGCFAGEVMRHNSPACAEDFAALAAALGWGAVDGAAFAGRMTRLRMPSACVRSFAGSRFPATPSSRCPAMPWRSGASSIPIRAKLTHSGFQLLP